MISLAFLPWLTVAFGALFCAAITWLIRRWARAHAFVDKPGGHKGHERPVALGGGVAVTLAVILPILIGAVAAKTLAGDPPQWMRADIVVHLDGIVAKIPLALAICGAAAAMCLLGLIDDYRPVGAGSKLIIQTAIAAGLVIGFELRLLAHLPYALSAGLSILWILTLTNAMNFLDNMDGLTAGVAVIAASVFGIASHLAGQIFVPTCCWLLIGVLLGYLPFNFHPATIFLGDAGSTVIGMLLAVFTILTTFVGPELSSRPFGVLAPIVVMAVPLYDTGSVFYLRHRLGIPIWKGDRRHFSHRLVRRGMSIPKAVLVIWLATLVTALPALLLPRIQDWYQAGIIFMQTFLVVCLVAFLESSNADGQTPSKS